MRTLAAAASPVREIYDTSVGRVEIMVDARSRTVSIYRFDATGRAVAAAIESADHVDIVDVLERQIGVPTTEAHSIGASVRVDHDATLQPRRFDARTGGAVARDLRAPYELRSAGLLLRAIAVFLDAIVVLFPMSIVVGLMTGGGYFVHGNGYAAAGVNVEGAAFWLLLFLAIDYYVVAEALTGATLGKRIVRIRVVGEDGEHVTFAAALVRNAFRLVDGLFFYLVGAIVAMSSERRQRVGDRVARTLVVRR